MRYQFIIFFQLLFSLVHAQPGSIDQTRRYFYDILDADGQPVVFARNPEYRIMVDGKLYSQDSIPHDKFPVWTPHTDPLNDQVRVNDFSLVLKTASLDFATKQPDIRIIRGNDTLFIRQPSTSRSRGGRYQQGQDVFGTMRLQFVPGRYHFPDWAVWMWEAFAQPKGKVKIANAGQKQFTIPRALYERLASDYNAVYQADSTVLANFTAAFTQHQEEQLTRFTKPLYPYDASFYGHFSPTEAPGQYYGLLGCSLVQGNCNSSKKIFARLDTGKNQIEPFFPEDEIRIFSCNGPYEDPFNAVLYLPVFVQTNYDFSRSVCDNNNALQFRIYRSTNKGRSWQPDKALGLMAQHREVRKMDFADKKHLVLYETRIGDNGRAQGQYSLIRNGVVVDSLVTPKDIDYNTNANNYAFSRRNDTILLGPWSARDGYQKGDRYQQPMLLRKGQSWEFKVATLVFEGKSFVASPRQRAKSDYRNFTVVHGNELVFRNGMGSLVLPEPVSDVPNSGGYFALEKDDRIFLFSGGYRHFYFSLDAGATWYFSPVPLQNGTQVDFLDIDSEGRLSYFSQLQLPEGGVHIAKLWYAFSVP